MRWLIVLWIAFLGCRSERAPGPEPAATGSATPQAAARLIALSPSATEIVAALDAADALVGVDDYSTFPPEVAGLPKVGSFLTPNLEAIIRLRPTLVIVDDVHAPTAGALRDAGVATIACPIHALPDVEAALRQVAAALGRPQVAATRIAEIHAALDTARARRPARRPRVLAVIDREAGGTGNLVAAGPGSWLDELLAVVGAENVLAGAGVRYPKLSLEEVLRGQPEVILDLSYAARAEITAWSAVDVPATRNHRVVALSEPYLLAPSPRVAAALAALAAAIAR